MTTRFVHTNIVARDWRRLAVFYQAVFGCTVVPPERAQRGAWLERGTGVAGAALEGVHLRLPGFDERGPTLEIYSYERPQDADGPPAADRVGLRHLAFQVDDVAAMRQRVIDHGGRALGEIAHAEIAAKGSITFVYVTDPEGNILELQRWDQRGPVRKGPE
jgi:predicted enzyme related to lactoylglutathione lyase